MKGCPWLFLIALRPVVEAGDDGMRIGADDDVARVHAGGGGRGVWLDAAYQQAGTVGHAKVARELRGHLLQVQAGVRGIHHHRANETVAPAQG